MVIDDVIEKEGAKCDSDNTSVFYILMPDYHIPSFVGSKFMPVFARLPDMEQWPEWVQGLNSHRIAWDVEW